MNCCDRNNTSRLDIDATLRLVINVFPNSCVLDDSRVVRRALPDGCRLKIE